MYLSLMCRFVFHRNDYSFSIILMVSSNRHTQCRDAIQAWATCGIKSSSVALKAQSKSRIENIGEQKVSFWDFKSHAGVLHTVNYYKTISSDPHQASRNHWKREISRKQDLDSFLFFPIFACNYVPFVKSNNSNRSIMFEWYRACKKTIKKERN